MVCNLFWNFLTHFSLNLTSICFSPRKKFAYSFAEGIGIGYLVLSVKKKLL